MKILFVNDYTEMIGGAEIYIENLKKTLEKKGHIVSWFGTEISKETYIQEQTEKSFSKFMRRIINIQTYKKFRAEVKKFKPDIIHLNNIFNEITPSILLGMNNLPVIMTVHDNLLVNAVSLISDRTGKPCIKRTCGGCMNCVGLKGMLYEKIKRPIHRFLLKKISLYITPSKFMRDFIVEAGFSPTLYIPNGFALFTYEEMPNKNRLLYIGRLSKDKGIEYLLRALPLILQHLPDTKLILVGEGSDRAYFESLSQELGINKQVKFTGVVSPDGVKDYYKKSQIVIVPSIYPDNFPTTCIEAMSIGRPVIATNVGGIPELVTNNTTGLLVPPQNERQLAKAVIKLLAEKKLTESMSRNAHRKAQAFSIEQYTDHIEKIYYSLIKKT